MPTDPISDKIKETAYYAGVSYHAIAEVATIVESVVGEDKSKVDIERRTRYRREFRKEHGLTSQVWARVPERFDGEQIKRGDHTGMEVRDYKTMSEKEIRSASYLCQLPIVDFLDLYDAVSDNLADYGGVLNQVNAVLEAMRYARANGTKPRQPSLAAQIVDKLESWQVVSQKLLRGEPSEMIEGGALENVTDELMDIPAIAAEIERRKGAK